jgi:hypothetical protein
MKSDHETGGSKILSAETKSLFLILLLMISAGGSAFAAATDGKAFSGHYLAQAQGEDSDEYIPDTGAEEGGDNSTSTEDYQEVPDDYGQDEQE